MEFRSVRYRHDDGIFLLGYVREMAIPFLLGGGVDSLLDLKDL